MIFQGKMKESTALVSVIMGSTSDYQTMQHAEKTLQELKIQSETLIISAHRTPILLKILAFF